MNTNQTGNVALGKAIAYFTSCGYVVSIPLTDTQPYDLVVDNGSLQRIQVRYSSTQENSGNYTVSLRVQSYKARGEVKYRGFNQSDYEFLFAVTPKGEYLIPVSNVTTKTAITISKDVEKLFTVPESEG